MVNRLAISNIYFWLFLLENWFSGNKKLLFFLDMRCGKGFFILIRFRVLENFAYSYIWNLGVLGKGFRILM